MSTAAGSPSTPAPGLPVSTGGAKIIDVKQPDTPASSTTKPVSSGGSAKVVDVNLIEQSGRYRIGPPTRPNIQHDNGFLDRFAREEPTVGDRVSLAKWRAILEGAEATRPDLVDGAAAYRHFLYGLGKDRTFSYERYVQNDPSGSTALHSMLADFKFHASIIGHNRERFSVTSAPYFMKQGDTLFPYPATENWHKAIGGHVAWISAEIEVKTDPNDLKDMFAATVTVHVEDRYNFNPRNVDIVTGIKDDENGRFEITGLAHQYMNYATLTREIKWKEGEGANAEFGQADTSRDATRRPSDNRRLRNRI